MSNCCEDAIGEIEAAVGQDVDFAAVEDRDVGVPLAEAGDFVSLALDAVDRQVARRRRARRVIGDREVLVAERTAPVDHRLDRVAAVAPRRVHVEIAADVGARYQLRQRPFLRRPDLIVAAANLRRDERQIDARVDLFFGGRGREELDVPLARDALDASDVLDRAGEVKQGGAGAGRMRESNAELERGSSSELQASLALMKGPRRIRQMRQVLDGARRIGGGRDDLQVADRVLAAPQRSARQRPLDAGKRAQPVEKGSRWQPRAAQREHAESSCEAWEARRRRPLSTAADRVQESTESPRRATAAPSSAALVAPSCW